MKYLVEPGGQLSGSHRVPGDKSMSHRVVMLGALAEGALRYQVSLTVMMRWRRLPLFAIWGLP